MPMAMLTNVADAGGQGVVTGPVIADAYNSTTTAIAFGALVAIQTPFSQTSTTWGVGTATTASTTTTAALNIGICVGGALDTGTGSTMAAAATGQVCIHGHCRALLDTSTNTSVAGHRLLISTITAGLLADATTTAAVAGVNYGVVLEPLALTTNAGTLVNIWFEKT